MKLTLCLLVLFTGMAWSQDAPPQRRKLDYRRDGERQTQTARPSDKEVPRDLVVVQGSDSYEVSGSRRDQDAFGAVRQEAERTAQAVARELASGYGLREYYKVGFYRAMRQALDQTYVGGWDYLQGERQASRDQRIIQDAESVGRAASDEQARARAKDEVERQFRDLSQEPDRRGRVERVPAPDFGGQGFEEPELEDVFQTYPLHSYGGWRNISFYEGWQPNPWELYRVGSYRDCFDDRWRRPDYALRVATDSKSDYFRSLTEEEQRAFKDHFQTVYEVYLAPYYEQIHRNAYQDGFNDGWSYGSFVASEWFYQRGFFDGARKTFAQVAAETFERQYPEDYLHFYDEEFERWSTNAVVEVRDLSFRDGNDNGVFEPGETLEAHYTLVNYGGVGGAFDLTLDGEALVAPQRRAVTVDARASHTGSEGLPGVLQEQLLPGSEYVFRLDVDAFSKTHPLKVNWPLIFPEQPRVLQRDNLTGMAELELVVENISTQPIEQARIQSDAGDLELGLVPAGARVPERFSLKGRHPLDMVAGRPIFEATLFAKSKRWGTLQFGLPEQTTDLANEDLSAVLVLLSQAETLDRERTELAQDLMIKRLRIDWDKVRHGEGNPYKHDVKGGPGGTALGRLVQAYEGNKDGIRQTEVFHGLGLALTSLAEDLPGTHPFLRKQFKKLAERLKKE